MQLLRVSLLFGLLACGNVKATPDGSSGGGSDSAQPDTNNGSNGCATTENCFNGVDDDCNGHVDCDDTACTGGATPIAECVADPGSATAGTIDSSACPSTYPNTTQLHTGLTAGTCAAGNCSCSGGLTGTPRCEATLKQQGGTLLSCNTNPLTSIFQNLTATNGCIAFTGGALGTGYYSLSMQMIAQCNAPSGGTPTKVAPTWQANASFCTGGLIGGGCATGQVCMPAAAKHCVLETGDQVECTRAGYGVKDTTQYFTGFDDSQRSCSCACNLTGTCGTAVAFGVGSCATTANLSTGCHTGFGGYDHAQAPNPNGAGCAVGTTSTGATSTTGFERTICCTN
jgi:hypothetical protein